MIVLLSFALLCVLSAALAWIDIRHGIIPDWLNFAIAGLGLLKIILTDDPLAAIEALGEGAAIGAAFWLLRRLYFSFRGVQGLGLGDVKLLGAAGRALTAQTSMSFGPFLAAGLLLTLGVQQYGF
jgi:leader peptidase (prepilin peptidase)/N-methyltransferase